MLNTQPVDIIPNEAFALAEEFVHNTSQSIFLTGKAGTGKTTFLKKIKSTTKKNAVVVAPTGVAAIHAGGTTIHSFFQLPFSPFIPIPSNQHTHLSDRYSLLKNLRIEGEKRTLFRELELLIIDEVSMVRCDVLDAIDTILRYFRKKEHLPFGGVQVLFIGDLFQLPPVMPENDWSLLHTYYQSAFFFDAYVIRAYPPVYLELKTIYRQRDPVFIDVLNKIRNKELTSNDIAFLNERYHPNFQPPPNDQYITLTTHNYRADAINTQKLTELPGDAFEFEGTVEGDFSERAFPTDKVLRLKVGAQVMFIKNDMERVRRYYNGKIATVKKITEGKIVVSFTNEEGEVEVEKDTWKNIKYAFNSGTKQIEEEALGSFTQYPLRLAWAITIHKSQGLTFDKLIIDAGNSFAPGQVYVALSRCTSLAGIILFSKIFNSSILTDERVVRFSAEEKSVEALRSVLHQARLQHLLQGVLMVFDVVILLDEVFVFKELAEKRKSVNKEELNTILNQIQLKLKEHQETADRFKQQLHDIVKKHEFALMQKRLEAGVEYFIAKIDEDVILPLQHYRKAMMKPKLRKFKKQLDELIQFSISYKEMFHKALTLSERFSKESAEHLH